MTDAELMARCEAILHAPLPQLDAALDPVLLHRVRIRLGIASAAHQYVEEGPPIKMTTSRGTLSSRYPRGRPRVRVQDRRNDPPPGMPGGRPLTDRERAVLTARPGEAPKLCEHCGETDLHFCYSIPGQPDCWRGPMPAWFALAPPDPNVAQKR